MYEIKRNIQEWEETVICAIRIYKEKYKIRKCVEKKRDSILFLSPKDYLVPN